LMVRLLAGCFYHHNGQTFIVSSAMIVLGKAFAISDLQQICIAFIGVFTSYLSYT
jgi:hypothetical protein